MIYKQFYSEIGKLLYAVADVDGVISPAEKKALKDLIRTELVPVENSKDEFGTDSAYYAEFEFDILEEANASPKAAFDSFINFLDNHHSAFDKKLKDATLLVVTKLADAYHKTSKKEEVLINQLKMKLALYPDRG